MAQRLTGMAIDKVALVDAGANGRTFAVLKRDDAPKEAGVPDPAAAGAADPTSETPTGVEAQKRGLFEQLKKWLFPEEPVAKTQTFASIVAGQELQEALGDSFWTLQDALWSAIYAYDENGQDLSIEAKQALVAQNLDEFKAYLLNEMADGTSVAKRDNSPAVLAKASVDHLVRKVGKKISGARMQRLQEAADALASVLAEVNSSDEETEKRAQPEEDPMTSDEIAQIAKGITEALEPRFAAIEKRLPAEEAEPVAKSNAAKDGDLTLAGIAEAIAKVLDRVEKLEGGRGERTSAVGQDPTGPVKKGDKFAGMLSGA